jgi:nucleotidyltransferase AbiEii toxin of type IV toxin-antitoxin system
MNNEATVSVIEALEACAIPYMLVGSYSSNAYGIPRSTQDADFVIELGEASITELARRLAPSIRIDPQMSFETVTMTRRYVADVVGTPFKIEFFLLNDDPHNQEQFRRRRHATLMDRQVWVPTVEDVIVTKLHWALLGKRSKDRDDVRDVIAVQGDRIDWDYVHRWCEQHGTRALLDEIRASIPPI